MKKPLHPILCNIINTLTLKIIKGVGCRDLPTQPYRGTVLYFDSVTLSLGDKLRKL